MKAFKIILRVMVTGLLICNPVAIVNAQNIDLDALLDSLESETYIAKKIQLEEVEIHGSRHQGHPKLLRYYKSNNLSTTEDIISKLSGISMIRRGNYAWEPVIHGMSGNQINVAIDGMQIFGACTDKMDPVTSYVEPNNLESISINTHNDSFIFGSNTGGSMGLSLKKPVFSQFKASAGTRYESVANGFSGKFSINQGKEKMAFRANMVFRKNNDYRTGDNELIPYSGFNKFNLSLGAATLLSKDHLLSFDALIDEAWDIGYPALPMDVEYAKARIFGLTLTQWDPFPGFTEMESKIYYNQVRHSMDDTHRPDVPMHMDMPGETQTAGGYIQLKGGSSKHEYQFKLDGFFNRSYAEMTMYPTEGNPMFMLTWPEVYRGVVGLAIQDQFRLYEKTGLIASVRFDVSQTSMNNELGNRQLSVFGFEDYEDPIRINPNVDLQIRHKLGNALNLQWGVGYRERLPSTAEQFGFYLYNAYDGFDYIGIPDLLDEKSLTGNISLELKKNKLEGGVELSGYWFRDYIFGRIDTDLTAMTIGANGVKFYENLESARILAIDSRLVYSPHKNFNTLLSVKYSHGSDDVGNPLPMIPPLKCNLGMRYQLQTYAFQMDTEWASEQNRISADFGESTTPSYALLHIRAFKNWKFGKHLLEAGFGVENLLDAAYQEHLDWGDIDRPGRNFVVNLDWRIN